MESFVFQRRNQAGAGVLLSLTRLSKAVIQTPHGMHSPCCLKGIWARPQLTVLGPWTWCESPCPQEDCQNHGVKASTKPSPWGCLHWALTPRASSQ